MTDYQKKLADALRTHWEVANDSEDQETQKRRWCDIHNILNGIQAWIIWGDEDEDIYQETKEDIRFLKDITWRRAWM